MKKDGELTGKNKWRQFSTPTISALDQASPISHLNSFSICIPTFSPFLLQSILTLHQVLFLQITKECTNITVTTPKQLWSLLVLGSKTFTSPFSSKEQTPCLALTAMNNLSATHPTPCPFLFKPYRLYSNHTRILIISSIHRKDSSCLPLGHALPFW